MPEGLLDDAPERRTSHQRFEGEAPLAGVELHPRLQLEAVDAQVGALSEVVGGQDVSPEDLQGAQAFEALPAGECQRRLVCKGQERLDPAVGLDGPASGLLDGEPFGRVSGPGRRIRDGGEAGRDREQQTECRLQAEGVHADCLSVFSVAGLPVAMRGSAAGSSGPERPSLRSDAGLERLRLRPGPRAYQAIPRTIRVNET